MYYLSKLSLVCSFKGYDLYTLFREEKRHSREKEQIHYQETHQNTNDSVSFFVNGLLMGIKRLNPRL